jgi:hypothetical protein
VQFCFYPRSSPIDVARARCVAAIITGAIAIDIGAVIIVVGMRLAGAPRASSA